MCLQNFAHNIFYYYFHRVVAAAERESINKYGLKCMPHEFHKKPKRREKSVHP